MNHSRARAGARKRRRVVTIVVAVVILFCVGGPGAFAGVQLAQAFGAVHSGMQHFKNAQADFAIVSTHPFDTVTISHARDEFVAAKHDFQSVEQGLTQYPSAVAMVPGPGSQFGAATRLAPIAVEGAQLGVIGCDTLSLLATRLKDPLNPDAQGLTAQDLSAMSDNFAQMKSLFTTISGQVAQLQPGDKHNQFAS